MTADVDIGNDEDRNYYPKHGESPLSTKYCACADEDEDVRLLAQDCMCHHCNRFCLRDNKKNAPEPVELVLVTKIIGTLKTLPECNYAKNQRSTPTRRVSISFE